jgi:asparagine synthase (glutamine-hydrolysing)
MTAPLLVFNNGYQWITQNDMSFKGFFYDESGMCYQGQKALSYLGDIHDLESCKDMMSRIDGSFAFILGRPDGLLIAVDTMCMFPVFYARQNTGWIVADNAKELFFRQQARQQDGLLKPFDKEAGIHANVIPTALRDSDPFLNHEALTEFEMAGFVLGRETLLKGIYRVQPGECVYLYNDDNSRKHAKQDIIQYNYFLPEAFSSDGQDALEQELRQVLADVTRKLLDSLNGETLVVPLSGGFDSRLIACMLKQAGYDKVVCFTYGRPNPEANISKQVADTLGYPWIFVNYDQVDSSKYMEDPDFTSYCQYMGNGVSMPYLQEYFGVKHLRDNKLIPENSVFLPGHSGDFLGGSYVEKTANFTGTQHEIVRQIAGKYFWFLPGDNTQRKQLHHRLHAWFNSQTYPGYASSERHNSLIEDWDVKEKLAKFIFNSAQVFPYFGYGVRFPLWDTWLRNYFRKLPYQLRSHKYLYDKVLIEKYFKPLGVYYGEGELHTPLQAPFKPTSALAGTYLSHGATYCRWVRKTTKQLLPFKLIQRKMKKNDWICYDRFTREMIDSLIAEGKRPPRRYNSYNAIICAWYIRHLLD